MNNQGQDVEINQEEKLSPPCCLPKRDRDEHLSDGIVWKGKNGDWVPLYSLTPGAKKNKK
jgi:hypothetical protein